MTFGQRSKNISKRLDKEASRNLWKMTRNPKTKMLEKAIARAILDARIMEKRSNG